MRYFAIAVLVFLALPATGGAQEQSISRYLPACLAEHVKMQETAFFSPFSLGGADDLPTSERERLRQFASDRSRHLVFRGTADTTTYHHIPDDRSDAHAILDSELANMRAQWARSYVGRGVVLGTPADSLESLTRGVHVYTYTCTQDSREAVTREDLSKLRGRLDRLENQVIRLNGRVTRLEDAGPSQWQRYAVVGVDFFKPSSQGAFILPTLGLALQRSGGWEHELSVRGGFWPFAGKTSEGDSYEASLLVEAAVFPWENIGAAVGIDWHYQSLKDGDWYLRRSYGVSAGPQLRWQQLWLSPALHWEQVDSWQTDSKWELGFGVRLSLFFLEL